MFLKLFRIFLIFVLLDIIFICGTPIPTISDQSIAPTVQPPSVVPNDNIAANFLTTDEFPTPQNPSIPNPNNNIDTIDLSGTTPNPSSLTVNSPNHPVHPPLPIPTPAPRPAPTNVPNAIIANPSKGELDDDDDNDISMHDTSHNNDSDDDTILLRSRPSTTPYVTPSESNFYNGIFFSKSKMLWFCRC